LAIKPTLPNKEIKMSTISAATHRTASMNLFIALAIVVVAVLAFAALSSIVVPKPGIIPVTGNQNAYVDFLRGEKAVFSGRIELGNVLSTFHAGEKAVYINAVDVGGALSTYRLGEKALYPSPVAANALSAWHSGEATIVRFDALESALLTWRQGEKDTH
jgi:hypothetical protein